MDRVNVEGVGECDVMRTTPTSDLPPSPFRSLLKADGIDEVLVIMAPGGWLLTAYRRGEHVRLTDESQATYDDPDRPLDEVRGPDPLTRAFPFEPKP